MAHDGPEPLCARAAGVEWALEPGPARPAARPGERVRGGGAWGEVGGGCGRLARSRGAGGASHSRWKVCLSSPPRPLSLQVTLFPGESAGLLCSDSANCAGSRAPLPLPSQALPRRGRSGQPGALAPSTRCSLIHPSHTVCLRNKISTYSYIASFLKDILS